MTDESHQAITTMRAAFEFIEDLRDRIATLTAQRDAAEKVCEAVDEWTGVIRQPKNVRAALAEWRITKEGETSS